VSDVNIAYRREALLGVRAAWKDGYQEPTVHAALRSAGESLRLDPRPVVEQRRRGLRFLPLLAERWHWGRLFGAIRAAELGAAHRLAFAAACPLLPLLLWGRHLRDRLSRRRLLGVFARATPAMLCLLVAWSFGEGVGYLTRRR
jgi:hypothetical protein